jgi:uncharacterized protein (DUF433 family)
MIDTTPVTTASRHDPLAPRSSRSFTVVAQAYPKLTLAELSEALQEATEVAERQAARRH